MIQDLLCVYSPPASLEAQSAQRGILFPLPLRGRQWKNTQSRFKWDKKATHDRYFQYKEKSNVIFQEGLCHFAFRRPCPVECEAYSSGVSEKQKRKIKNSAIFATLR